MMAGPRPESFGAVRVGGPRPEDFGAVSVAPPEATSAPQAPFELSGDKTSGWVGGMLGYDPKALGITPAENIAGHPLTRFALGAGSFAGGAAQLGAKAVGADSAANAITEQMQEVEALKQTGQKAMGTEGIDFAGGAGAMAGGVAGLAKLGIKGINTALKGAAVGGGFGAATPVMDTEDFWKTKTLQTSLGAVFGGLVPVVIRGGTYVWDQAKNILMPLFGKFGRHLRAGKLLSDLAGNDKEAIEKLLAENKMYVSGSQATAAEVAAPSGRAEFVALESAAKAVKPTPFDRIAKGQEAARLKAVQDVGKDKITLDLAEAARSSEAKINYGAAYEQAVKADPRLAQIHSNPYFQDALPDAIKLAKAGGITAKTDLTRFLHFTKISLDKMIAKTGDSALSNTERAAATNVKNEVLGWLKKKNPAYDAARKAFREASKPINEMQVGQELESALTKPLGVGERPGVFAGAMRESARTMKKATGQPRFEKLDEVLQPENLAKVKGVLADLSRKAEADRLAGLGARKAAQIEAPFGLPATGPLHQGYMIFKTVLGRVSRGMTDETIDIVSEALQIPANTLKLMQHAQPSVKSDLIEQISRRYARNLIAAGATSSARGADK